MDWVEFRHSGQSLPHTKSALEFWCCFKMRSWAPSPLIYWIHYYIVCILFYCQLSGQYCSHQDDLWHVALPDLTLLALEKLGVCRCWARMTCYLPTMYNARDVMVHGALASWWMCSQAVCTHTRLKVFASIVAHLLSAWPRPWKQFINHYWLS